MAGPFYLALGADNRLLRVSVAHVVGSVPGEEGGLEGEAVTKVEAALAAVPVAGWTNYRGGWSSCGCLAAVGRITFAFAFLVFARHGLPAVLVAYIAAMPGPMRAWLAQQELFLP